MSVIVCSRGRRVLASHTSRLVTLMVTFLATSVMVCSTGSASGVAESEDPGILMVAVSDTCGEHLPMEKGCRNHYDKVADLIRASGTDYYIAVGDLQHDVGILEHYLTYYDTEFGDLMDITYPVPGNHDYYFDTLLYGTLRYCPWKSSNGSGYLAYFGDRLAEIANNDYTLQYSFYSYDVGDEANKWHVIALNSHIAVNYDHMEEGSPAWLQYEWLEQDLADHPNDEYPGTIVYFHHLMYNWEIGYDLVDVRLAYLWDLLDACGADMVLSGHSHMYQRWAPQDAYGNFDEDGIRQFTVGAGGYYLNDFSKEPQPDNFEFGQNEEFGVLELTLYKTCYVYEFVSISGSVLDSGTVLLR